MLHLSVASEYGKAIVQESKQFPGTLEVRNKRGWVLIEADNANDAVQLARWFIKLQYDNPKQKGKRPGYLTTRPAKSTLV